MGENVLDYSRLLRVFGYSKLQGEEQKIKNKVLHYLGQSFSATIDEFRVKLEKAQKEIKNISLSEYRELSNFKAAWQLVHIPSPLMGWDFLSCFNPEKAGILCGTSIDNAVLLTEESFKDLGLFERDAKRGNGVLDLYLSLSWWREAVSCVWASIIINQIIGHFYKRSALMESNLFFSQETIKTDPNEPMGNMLNVCVSNEEADKFYQLYDKAAFGSRSCEESVAGAFKEWLSGANIGILQKYAVSFEEAHLLLLAGSQQMPYIDIDLCWDQKTTTFQFMCFVKNNDIHGYENKKMTTYVPANILCDFFANATPRVKEDLFRLLIRGGWQKARNLIFKAFNHDLD